MFVRAMQTQLVYSSWANERLLEVIERTRDTDLDALGASSFTSVRATWVHIVAVQQTWLARLRGEDPPELPETVDFPDVAALRAFWERVDRATTAYALGLREDQMTQVVHYVGDDGQSNAYPRWQILAHIIFHAQQHRSELAMQLTSMGYEPGWFDFLHYLDLRDGTTMHDE